MASPGNRHCASCIGTLSFLIFLPHSFAQTKTLLPGHGGRYSGGRRRHEPAGKRRGVIVVELRGERSRWTAVDAQSTNNKHCEMTALSSFSRRPRPRVNRAPALSRVQEALQLSTADYRSPPYRHRPVVRPQISESRV